LYRNDEISSPSILLYKDDTAAVLITSKPVLVAIPEVGHISSSTATRRGVSAKSDERYEEKREDLDAEPDLLDTRRTE
jgi:hypothetical protein